jgi:hypothetical protein
VKKKKLGEVLQERGHISALDLTQVVSDQQGKVIRLGELMLERGLVTKPDLASALEEVIRVPYFDCFTANPDRGVLALVPRQLAIRCCVFPLAKEGAKLIVVMAEPQNVALSDEVKFSAGSNISPRLGFRNEIVAAIEKHYGAQVAPDETATVPATTSDQSENAHQMEFVSTSSRQANRDAIGSAG